MNQHYFKLWYRLGGRDGYLVWWSSSHQDGVVVDAAGRVPSFESIAALLGYARGRGLAIVDEEPILHDLDRTANWLSTEQAPVDCDDLLSAWNLFDDVSTSTVGDFDPDRDLTGAVYDKLFFGSTTANNVLKPEDEPVYQPAWSESELELLRAALSRGLSMFERVLRAHDSRAGSPGGL